MSRKKIMFVFGTRPEAIKLAPVIEEMKKRADVFACSIVTTGQHKEMLDQMLKYFKIKPDRDLGIMEKSQSQAGVVVRALQGLERILRDGRPDMMVVQGDTTTTFAAALSAYYHKVPLAHVEAGLRTWDKHRPYPEEMNRKLTSSLADLHLAPTRLSAENLKSEGVKESSVYVTGNTVIDALLEVAGGRFDLDSLGLKFSKSDRLLLLTTHRRESFGPPMRSVLSAVRKIADGYGKSLKVVFPVHRNPEVVEAVSETLSGVPNVTLIEPLDYIPFVHLMKRSHIILTDSGGIQEEAPSLGKPVLVLRELTERPEGVDAGTVRVVGMSEENILRETKKLLEDKAEYERMSRAVNPYGDGRASKRIAGAMLHYFKLADKRPEEFSGMKEKAVA